MGSVAGRWKLFVLIASVVVALSALAVPSLAGSPSPGASPSALDWTVSGSRIMVLAPGPVGSLDAVRVFQPSVIRAINGSYLMYYTGYDGSRDRIVGAYSPDGVVWRKLGGSIFLNDGAASPFLMIVGSQYRMWFESVVWGSGPLGYTDRIYAANSSDGLSWTITGVVVDVGGGSAWDAGSVGDPWVARAPDGGYRMYFSMYAVKGGTAIGIATSTDLASFIKWPGNPALSPGAPGSWDDFAVDNPSVVPGAPWALFYAGRQGSTHGQIGLATSLDGYQWTLGSAPLLPYDAPGTWDSGGVGDASYLAGPVPRLYYDGGSNSSSTNGIGLVNLSVSENGSTGTTSGLPLLEFLFLIFMTGLGVAVVVVVALVLRSEYRQRPPPPRTREGET